jgi:hypothetical protein
LLGLYKNRVELLCCLCFKTPEKIPDETYDI